MDFINYRVTITHVIETWVGNVDYYLCLIVKGSDYPPYEKLMGDLKGAHSRRINRQHRVVYQIYNDERTIKIISMWLHYE